MSDRPIRPPQEPRRTFIKKLGASTIALAGAPALIGAARPPREQMLELAPEPTRHFGPNEKINLACIGTGGMGFGDIKSALEVDGVKLVGVCDLYDGRLERAKEKYGDDLFTTRDYREILDRKDVDAIICATSDHWHEVIAVDAMNAGKAVYCEKPMTRTVDEAHRIIETRKKTGAVFQVGSQFASSIIHAKAKELLAAGRIGTLNFVEAMFDRHSFLGAWQYSVPRDASEETVDWQRYTANTTKRPFDAKRFFRWRNYRDYGTGIAGDLFVHLLTMVHVVTGSHGPTHVSSTGGLRHFDDGREVPDIQIAMFDYPTTDVHPAFNLVGRANFVDGGGGKYLFRLVGDEGEIGIGWRTLALTRRRWAHAPRTSIDSFAETQRKVYEAWHAKQYPEHFEMEGEPDAIEYKTPKGYKGDRYLHFRNFFAAMRGEAEVVEGPEFGLRAAGPSLAANKSYFEKRVVRWNPETMRIERDA